MLKSFNRYFKDFINDRTEEIYRKILLKDKHYLELTSQIVEVQYRLMDDLPHELQSLVNRYDEAEAEQDGIAMPLMYGQGFIDGVRFTRLIDRICKKSKNKS